jgi:hypothetical protein
VFLKTIVCNVKEENKEAFSFAQEQWSSLRRLEGFRMQFGGWLEINEQHLAIIAAFWSSETTYNDFMRNNHDQLFNSNNQGETYENITVKTSNVFEFTLPASPFPLLEMKVILQKYELKKRVELIKDELILFIENDFCVGERVVKLERNWTVIS